MPELCLDGLVGPTHTHAGLASGNLAAQRHAGEVSNPKRAALEGLTKLRHMLALGTTRGVLPPQPRPAVQVLRRLGFEGSDERVIERAAQEPGLLTLVSSASSMWAANAATVIPSCDSRDGRLHLVVANLVAQSHRSFEAETTERVLSAIFQDATLYAVHPPLPAAAHFSDEGAANHLLLHSSRARIHVFGWGRSALGDAAKPSRHSARQTLEASAAVARMGLLEPSRLLLWQQAPEGIDAGAFHSDVLAVGNGSVLLLHEAAFVDVDAFAGSLSQRLGAELSVVLARSQELSLRDAVSSYAFNSELVRTTDGALVIVAPEESRDCAAAHAFLQRAREECELAREIAFVGVSGSMKNGGGPACLRLRLELTEAELAGLASDVVLNDARLSALQSWVERHYRDRMRVTDLADPALYRESLDALDELTGLLGLGAVYDFQRSP
ncbi:MAG: N-succinylarginine dihydrolase [Polyangiaceae bacterium]|nr:N-succinylarginine dihydrolase [Polyangiaceae bacterium]